MPQERNLLQTVNANSPSGYLSLSVDFSESDCIEKLNGMLASDGFYDFDGRISAQHF